ncbi:hypothetical protein [Mesorhizobium sp. YR577]|uniref:hypothetical protein n=1 Tax=Mesorhizobium sp. YR577 TaxID=1884373 RepID=UPI0008EEF1FF|nr:hypothetical protein [Mesorhizobium sp. YR577]SFT71515.1 hypothetical protein SAMN05518861_10463 [Mesorhizobium sp. YR577]
MTATATNISDAELEAMSKDIVWGVSEIGKLINRSERQTYYLLERGLIPTAKKIGSQWVASRRALLRFMLEGIAG